MKEIYLKGLELLDTVPAVRWSDLDKGQLEFYETRPAVNFPCALLKVVIDKTENLGQNMQLCHGRVIVRLGFNYIGETSSITPQTARSKSLEYFDILESVYLAFQGKPAGKGKLDRQSAVEENRPDGLKVISLPFATSWIDKTASQ